MRLMEVRCCCVPEKVLGHMPSPISHPGVFVANLNLENSHWAYYVPGVEFGEGFRPSKTERFEVKEIHIPTGNGRKKQLAIYGDDRSKEWFQENVQGFIPNENK